MKKKTMKKILNAQKRLAGVNKGEAMFSVKCVGVGRVCRVGKFVLSHRISSRDNYIMGNVIKDLVDSKLGIVKNDGTVIVMSIYNHDLFTDF